MSSDLRPFMPAFGEIKVDQITESKMSTVISMLPTSLQSRMGPIRFLRRSMSLHSLRTGILVSGPSQKPRPLSEADVSALTRQSEGDETRDQSSTSLYTNGETKMDSPQPMSRVLYSELLEDDRGARAASGIHWKFARQGTSLVSISVDGGKPAVAEEDVAFERKAYIDGVTYLLKGLPQDLDLVESRRIQEALPVEAQNSDLVAGRPGGGSTPNANGQPRSILHRGVQRTVVNLVFLFSFLMPYLLFLVKHAARMERKYRISESLVNHGLDLVNAIGKQSIALTETVGQMNDGKVGQTLLEALTWTVNGVTQGISDGLGEGISIVGGRKST
ncbi:hypothetical protein G7046_g7200 [Stylonectria norvegica]|nr:hypothetical protein G7046_g7200 [Stylonectria norvegica]